MTHSLSSFPLAVLAAAVMFGTFSAARAAEDPAALAGLAPHKALYDIKLASAKSGSQILNVKGQMFYEWQPSCEAWNSSHRFNLIYEYADSKPLSISSDFSTFETFDGKSLNFTSQRKRDGSIFEEVRGSAAFSQARSEAVYTIPDGLTYKLPEGTLFPMQHTLALLEQAKAGKKFFTSVMFDGSDENGPVQVTAFIGPPEQKKAGMIKAAGGLDENLLAGRSWKVRLAFFPLHEPQETSDYEMDMRLYENGVVGDMTVDYDDFSITQTLTALETLGNTCAGEK